MIKKLSKIFICMLLTILFATRVMASKSQDIEAVENALTTAFDIIKSLDIEKIKKYYYDEKSKKYIDSTESFFDNFPEAKWKGQYILGEIDYKIKESYMEDDKINVKVEFSMPNIPKIVKKIMPKLLFKNFVSLFSEKLSGKNIMYIIDCIYEEVAKEKSDITKYEKMDITYDFVFVRNGNMWSIGNIADIEKKIGQLIRK